MALFVRDNPFDRRRRRRVLLSAAILVPLTLSLGVHGALGLFVRFARLVEQRPERLTDASGTESVLVLGAPATAVPERRTVPPPPRPVEPRPPEPGPGPVDSKEPVPEISEPTGTSAGGTAPADVGPVQPAPAVFAGVRAEQAGKIVYVVDASGAMTTSLEFVLEELSRSIARLDESQWFQIVLFRERPADAPSALNRGGYEMFRPELIAASPANKDAARAWLTTIRPVGRSTPLAGLRAALALRPDLVFLLTRSIPRSGPGGEWGEGNAAVLAKLDDLNPTSAFTGKRRVVIKAIQFIDDDPSGLLKAIADQHGDGEGSYAVRRLEELRGEEEKR